jgi:hypothetical protein
MAHDALVFYAVGIFLSFKGCIILPGVVIAVADFSGHAFQYCILPFLIVAGVTGFVGRACPESSGVPLFSAVRIMAHRAGNIGCIFGNYRKIGERIAKIFERSA